MAALWPSSVLPIKQIQDNKTFQYFFQKRRKQYSHWQNFFGDNKTVETTKTEY